MGGIKTKSTPGFTIVELLIVIVVIGILAALVVSTFSGVQGRARDAKRESDIAAITKALEIYYLENGVYPGTPGQTGGSSTINGSWSTTADSSWQNFINTLKPYMGQVPTDPISTPNVNLTSSTSAGYGYAYFASGTNYCGAAPYQMYILIYRTESKPQKDTIKGPCPTNALSYTGVSNYRVVKE